MYLLAKYATGIKVLSGRGGLLLSRIAVDAVVVPGWQSRSLYAPRPWRPGAGTGSPDTLFRPMGARFVTPLCTHAGGAGRASKGLTLSVRPEPRRGRLALGLEPGEGNPNLLEALFRAFFPSRDASLVDG